MSLDSPSNDNDNENKRNFSPESDSGMNSNPTTGGYDSSVESEVFDQNVVATSTPHRAEDIPQPPNILGNKDNQLKNTQDGNDNSDNFLNTSGDSHKENFQSNISDDISAAENGPLTNALYRNDPTALTENLFNTSSFRLSNTDEVYLLKKTAKELKEENVKLQQAYQIALLESSEKSHTITFQQEKIKNLEAMTHDQEKIISEKNDYIEKLSDDCKRIPEFETQINNLHSMIEKKNFSFEIQKDQLLKLQENKKELSHKVRSEVSEEFSKKIKMLEEEKTDLKRKLSHAEEGAEKAQKKMKECHERLELAEHSNKELKERIKKLSKKPSVIEIGLQTDKPESVDEKTTHSLERPGNTSMEILYAGVKTPIRNTDFSNTMFTTPGMGDQTMLNKFNVEVQEMLSASEKLKMVVDFLKKEEQGGGINEDVKRQIIEETTSIIDAELLKQLKNIVQPLQIFETLAKAQRDDLAILQQKNGELENLLKKDRGTMLIIAKEFEMNCFDSEGELDVRQFWNGLPLYINDLKKAIVNISKSETKTTFNGLTPVPKNMKQFNTPKDGYTNLRDGRISPILYNNVRSDMTVVKDDKENLLKDMFAKFGEAKEELAKYKQSYKQALEEKEKLTSKYEKKFNEYDENEKKYEKSVSELKEIVDNTQREYVNAQTKLKRAKKIIQKLGSSYQEHFNLYHKDMKIDSAAYDCFSVLKHVSEFTKHK
uniref:Spc7 domain-containing protein n=1 Tax=Strongyloides venezuelensis TaxID=75913 RepID=A0A0K0FZT4_STRVS